MERNKFETYKGILYILLLIYCCFEISNNFNEIVDNFIEGNRLMSVKLIKEASGYDLKTAKEIFDKFEQKLNE